MSESDGTQGDAAPPQGSSGGGATEVDVIREDVEGGAELLPGAAGQTPDQADQLYGGGFTAAGQESALTAYAGVAPERQASLWGDAWRQLRRKPLFIVSALLVLLFTVMAIAPGLFTNQDPRDCNLSHSLERPSAGHWFGYDLQGCDYYSMTIYGTRPSLAIGLLVVLVDAIIAVILGCIAAYFGGAYDTVIARTADIFFAIPITLGGIVILNVLRTHSLLTVSLVLVILGWPTIMRLMRSTVLATKEVDYVAAARALGASNWRVLSRHIVPNAIAPVIVYSTISVGIIISAEAALSFLGVGLQLPAISWGLMIAAAQSRVLTAPYLLLFPSLFLSMLVLSFILMGDALRDALDPKLR
jgi:oligopeptide transport system permease protein